MKKLLLMMLLVLPIMLAGRLTEDKIVTAAKSECSEAMSQLIEKGETFESYSPLELSYKTENDSIIIFTTDVEGKIELTQFNSSVEIIYWVLPEGQHVIALNNGLDFGSLLEKTKEFRTQLVNEAPEAFGNYSLDDCFKLVIGQLLLHDKLKSIKQP